MQRFTILWIINLFIFFFFLPLSQIQAQESTCTPDESHVVLVELETECSDLQTAIDTVPADNQDTYTILIGSGLHQITQEIDLSNRQNITIRGSDSNNKPEISFPDETGGFQIDNSENITLDTLKIVSELTRFTINLTNSSNVKLDNLDLHNIKSQYVSELSSAAVFLQNTDSVTISNSLISNSPNEGVLAIGNENILIEKNRFIDLGGEAFGSNTTNGTFRNNLFVSINKAGMSFVDSVQVDIAHNTFVTTATESLSALYFMRVNENPVQATIGMNNFVKNGHVFSFNSSLDQNLIEITQNNFWDNDSRFTEESAFQEYDFATGNNLELDPLISSEYCLTSESPLIFAEDNYIGHAVCSEETTIDECQLVDLVDNDRIDLYDYLDLAENFLSSEYSRADFDNSGRVDLPDYLLLVKYFLSSCEPDLSEQRLPTNEAVLNTVYPEFQWIPIDGAETYRLQVATGPGMTTKVINQVFSQTKAVSPIALNANTTYYWRVSPESDTREWNEVWSFTTPENVPAAPVLLNPGNNTHQAETTPLTFNWRPVNTAVEYKIQVARDQTMTQDLVTLRRTTNSLEYVVGFGDHYYWRVAAVNEQGLQGPWSSIRSFYTPARIPFLDSPDDGALLNTNEVQFEWSDDYGTVQYQIQVDNNENFGSPAVNRRLSATQTTETLPDNRTYYWRVRGKNAKDVWSDWSEVFTFEVPDVPTAPTAQTPNSTITTASAEFTWRHSDPQPDSQYRVELATSNTFEEALVTMVTPQADEIANSVEIDVEPNTSYFWRVRAEMQSNVVGPWSNVRSFDTTVGIPELISPAIDATLSSQLVNFNWSEVEGATQYRIRVSRNNANFGTSYSNDLEETTLQLERSDDSIYYWKVRAYSPEHGWGDFSEVHNFRIIDLPAQHN